METLESIVGVEFTWYDYSFFFLMVLVSGSIGIYYGLYKKQETAMDYIFGGKTMLFLPIALSVIASNVNGVAILAIPSDVYRYGISYWFTYVSIFIVIFVSYWAFIPIFWKLQTTSTFEYLKHRFNEKVRLLGSSIYLAFGILIHPVTIYVPSLALAQATGINVHLLSIVVCILCIFYASLGGLRAVVYSDAFQAVLMILSLVVTLILGVYKCGGLQNIWVTSYNHDRLFLTFEWDLTNRNTVWAVTIGTFVMWLNFMGQNQIYIQRYLSLSSYSDIIKVLIVSAIGILAFGSLTSALGLVIYTEYSNCDPFEAGILQKLDQLVPYYVMQLSKLLPGLAGLLVAGICSACLSTLSTYLNSLSVTIYEDFIAHRLPKATNQRRIGIILKAICLILGILFAVLVVLVEKLGGILAIANSIAGITCGSLLGLFGSGMFIPIINSGGAYYGALTSTFITTSIAIGSMWYQTRGYVTNPPLPVSIEGCLNLNITSNNVEPLREILDSDDIPYIFKITFYWYSSIGLIVYLVVAIIISILTRTNETVNRDLLSPVIHPFLSTKYSISPTKEHPEYCYIPDTLNAFD